MARRLIAALGAGGRPLLLAYALALAASHALRASGGPGAPSPQPGTALVEVDGVAIVLVRTKPVTEEAGALPVVLLHGSPGGRSDLGGVASVLSDRWPTVRPDLPGFGASQRDVPDYSIRAHARWVHGLLERLGLERVHLVGFSMGGGVALELAGAWPERVASLSLVSSIGVQELELFGHHGLNRVLHAVQLGLLRGVHELVPHFGLLDRSILSVEYARNFFDTDQRPLRDVLARWRGPTLVLHGRDDALVPWAAAREHARLVPQSRLETLDGGHLLVFRRPDVVGQRLARFLEDVEAGRAATRAEAAPERVARASLPYDPRDAGALAGLGLWILLGLVALATLVSEDLTCLAVGALVGQGRVPFVAGTVACLVGITLGDFLLFFAGRTLGRRALRRAPLAWFLGPERVRASSAWFEARGPIVVLASRFLPGTRLPTYFAAGLLRTSFVRFAGWFLLASVLWTPALVWLASLGGGLLERVEPLRRNLALGGVLVVVFGLVVVKGLVPLASARGRLLQRARWTRLRRWEHWPWWVVYAPIVGWIVWLAARYRGRLTFTAANPAMPHGGVVGESKGEILAALAAASDAVAPTARLGAGLALDERLAAVARFRARHGGDGALVVKPDQGQRGEGVRVCRTPRELRTALAEGRGDQLVQAFVPGVEYGLFYARHPDERRGRLLSITEKRLPVVVGDGEHTLEELVLRDPHAAVHARLHLAEHAHRLREVPAAGGRVPLGEVGTHCRGARFLDAAALATPGLEASVDAVSRAYPGFYFGRYDVRAASPEALAAGRFTILELNGVTSEMGHVYDPGYTLLDGWKALAWQWRLAFEIGAANARHGARCSGPLTLLRALLAYQRRGRAGGEPGEYPDGTQSTGPERREERCGR